MTTDDGDKELLPRPVSTSSPQPRSCLPTRQLTRFARRRPLLSLIAIATFSVSCTLFLLPDSAAIRPSWPSFAQPPPDPPPDLPSDSNPHIPDPWPAIPTAAAGPARAPPPMVAHVALNGECLEAWIARGELCAPGSALDELIHAFQSVKVLDSVWTWVNGSDRRHQLSRAYWLDRHTNDSIYIVQPPDPSSSAETVPPLAGRRRPGVRELIQRALGLRDPQNTGVKWFRDHNELKYSIRSVKQHLKPLRNMHVIATDFRHPFVDPAKGAPSPSPDEIGFSDLLWTADDASNGGWREGQWPQWIDRSHSLTSTGGKKRDGSLTVHHHWDIFALPSDTGYPHENWKNRALPTFNSMAIESQLTNLPGLAENFIYMNDDVFLGRDLTAADFYTPLFGPVFRMQAGFGVDGYEISDMPSDGEWPPLHRSNWVLCQRFGDRKRPYLEHTTKTFNLPILQETRMMFPEAFAETSMHRFRGWGHDVVTPFLSSHMTVERHREALLWSFLVAKGDVDGNNYLDEWELNELLDVITTDRDAQQLKVPLPDRDTLKNDDAMLMLDTIKFPRPAQTRYQFSSRDGYADYRPRPGSWPAVYGPSRATEFCSVDLPKCFPEAYQQGGQVHVNTLMKRVAFAEKECGDCIIFQLMNAAGKAGLEPFLPNASAFPVPDHDIVNDDGSPSNGLTPFLPVGPHWEDLDYTLVNIKSITGWSDKSNRREFAMKLIQRYNYMMGSTAFQFISLERPQQSQMALQRISGTRPALICINDDIISGEEEVDHIFGNWLEQTFPEQLPFEL